MSLRAVLPRYMQATVGEAAAGVELAWYTDASDCAEAVRGAEILWLNMWRTDEIEAVLRAGERLRWVSYDGAGVDSFPLELFRERGIQLTNARGLAAVPIAEYVVMAVLAAAKRLAILLQAQARAEWLTRKPRGADLAGSRALIIGYGSIGRTVAARLRAFDVEVTGVRLRVPADEPDVIGPDEWQCRLGQFDWVILCTPLTDRTRSLIGPAELSAMKPTAWILNVSRGPIVDAAALEMALRNGSLGGACLDVTEPEPLPGHSPLWHMANVLITPHTSASSPRSRERLAALFADNLARYQQRRPLRNLVDLALGY